MLSPDHQELLSAHFDGELADEERAQVDALLNESQEARELLQEFDEISAALRDIEVSETPKGIRASVLEQIATTAPTAPKPRPRRLAWQRWLAPALAASLALMVAVWVQTQQPTRPPATPMADAVTTPATLDSLTFRTTPEMEAVAEASPDAMAFSSEMEGTAPRDEMGRFSDSSTSGFAAPPAGAAMALSERLFPDGSRPVPGETRTLLGQQGEAPVLVNYFVVDVEKAAGRMRVLLTQNGIHDIAASTSTTENEAAAPNRELLEEDRLFALYVEAPQDQVVAALNDIDGIQEVVDVSADYAELSDNLSVKAEALPYRMQQKWMAARRSSTKSDPAGSSLATTAPTEAAGDETAEADEATRSRPSADVDAAKPADTSVRSGAVGESIESYADMGANSRQLKRGLSPGTGVQMQVSEEQVEKLMRLRTRNRQRNEAYQLALPSPPARPPAPPAPEPLDSESPASEQGLAGRRVKVLLILQDQGDQ